MYCAFALLRRNVEENRLTGVHLYNVALSDTEGSAVFYVDHAKPGSPRMSLTYERMPKDTLTVETSGPLQSHSRASVRAGTRLS